MFRHLLIPMLMLAGCGQVESFEDPEAAHEEATIPATEAALSSLLADELDPPLEAGADEIANATATRVKDNVTPAGCLTTTTEDTKTTYVFVDCTAKYGLVKLNGTVTATYSRQPEGVTRVLLSSLGFKANDATFDLKATVDGSQQGTVKRADITSQTTAKSSRGLTITRDGTYAVTWDDALECLRVDGSNETSRGTSTSISNLRWCKAQCPASGTVVHATKAKRAVTLVFDGTATASWSSETGKKGTLALTCSE